MGKLIAGQVSGTPPAGDIATDVVSGVLSARAQASSPYVFWGPFNLAIWLQVTGNLNIEPNAATGVLQVSANGGSFSGGAAVGQSLNTPNGTLPPGGVVASLTTTGIGGLSTAQISGFTTVQVGTFATTITLGTLTGPGTAGDMTIVLEKSYDAGNTWLAVNTDKAGTAASWHLATANINNAVTIALLELEKGVAYRLRCSTFGSGTVSYRLSDSGPAAAPWGINTTS